MPKLPKGMKRRRKAFYLRRVKAGKEVWIPLGSDYQTACQRMRELKRAPVTPASGNVGQAADAWLKTYISTARAEKSQRVARQRVNDYLKPFLGVKPITRVKSDDLREYRLWLEGKDLAPLSVFHILSDARCLLNWAEAEGYISRSPFPRRVMPRIQERPPDRLTDEEVDRVLAIEEPYGFIIRLGLGTGMRWGELTRAKASDLKGNVVTISQTKSGKVRRVPITADLAREIRSRVGLLVGPMHPSVFARAVRRRSGVERFHPHQLRHSFACRWLERGGTLPALQELLGHATIVTTQRYARLMDDAIQAEAARVLGGTMGNGMGNAVS